MGVSLAWYGWVAAFLGERVIAIRFRRAFSMAAKAMAFAGGGRDASTWAGRTIRYRWSAGAADRRHG